MRKHFGNNKDKLIEHLNGGGSRSPLENAKNIYLERKYSSGGATKSNVNKDVTFRIGHTLQCMDDDCKMTFAKAGALRKHMQTAHEYTDCQRLTFERGKKAGSTSGPNTTGTYYVVRRLIQVPERAYYSGFGFLEPLKTWNNALKGTSNAKQAFDRFVSSVDGKHSLAFNEGVHREQFAALMVELKGSFFNPLDSNDRVSAEKAGIPPVLFEHLCVFTKMAFMDSINVECRKISQDTKELITSEWSQEVPYDTCYVRRLVIREKQHEEFLDKKTLKLFPAVVYDGTVYNERAVYKLKLRLQAELQMRTMGYAIATATSSRYGKFACKVCKVRFKTLRDCHKCLQEHIHMVNNEWTVIVNTEGGKNMFSRKRKAEHDLEEDEIQTTSKRRQLQSNIRKGELKEVVVEHVHDGTEANQHGEDSVDKEASDDVHAESIALTSKGDGDFESDADDQVQDAGASKRLPTPIGMDKRSKKAKRQHGLEKPARSRKKKSTCSSAAKSK